MPSLQDYERDDSGFEDDLRASMAAVQVVNKKLERWGYITEVPEIEIRPDISQMREYADRGDIWIQERVEVKHRKTAKFNFHSLEEYPYKTVLVDVCHAYDWAKPKPVVHFIVNQDFTGYLVVPRHTRKYWEEETIPDKGKKRTRHVYMCPLELCTYRDI